MKIPQLEEIPIHTAAPQPLYEPKAEALRRRLGAVNRIRHPSDRVLTGKAQAKH
jgi:hypothetical protein